MTLRKCIACFAIITCLIGCGRAAGPDEGGKPRIALVLKTLNNPFFIDLQRGAEEAAGRLGVDLIVQAAERDSDAERQMQIIENMIQIRVDLLCIVPSGASQLLPAIKKANQAGIPVIIVDQRIDEEAAKADGIQTEMYLGSDNLRGGEIAGEYMAKAFDGKAKVAILEGVLGQDTAALRLGGFMKGIKDHPGMEVIASQTANYERDQGFNVFQNMLTAHPEIEALFACNDMMALGAIEAIRAAGKTGDIVVVGFDAIADAREAIREGTMAGSIAQFPVVMGQQAIEHAVTFLAGETVPEHVPVPIELITKENL